MNIKCQNTVLIKFTPEIISTSNVRMFAKPCQYPASPPSLTAQGIKWDSRRLRQGSCSCPQRTSCLLNEGLPSVPFPIFSLLQEYLLLTRDMFFFFDPGFFFIFFFLFTSAFVL